MNIKLFSVFFGFLLTALAAHSQTSTTETFKFSERRYGQTEVPVEINLPASGSPPFPVIISQHGSERDGKSFTGGVGKTDEYTKRLVERASARGYAVLAIDAFHNKGLGANDKMQFPTASAYAEMLRDKVGELTNLDPNNIFYTGFSYGGRSVLDALYKPMEIAKWRALAAAEPDCNSFAAPKSLPTPVLVMKGEESHYPPKPCQIMAKMYQEAGSDFTVKIFSKSNHYFSRNGRIVKGKAYNGCSDDPIVNYGRGDLKTASGIPVSAESMPGRCMTATGGSGKSREDLNQAVDTVLDFFDKHKTK